MKPAVIGMFAGLLLAIAAAAGGFVGFLIALVLGAIGFAVGRLLEGATTVDEMLRGRGRTRV